MPRFRSQQQPVFSGLGMAGAVLAAVVVTFAVASGIVTYSLTSDDPMATSSAALVLELRAADPGDAPLVLRAQRTDRTRGRTSPGSGSGAATAMVRGAAHGTLSASGRSQLATGGAPSSAGPPDQTGSSVQGPGRPAGTALGETTQAVGTTTDTLGRRVETVTDSLATTVGPVVDQTVAAVQTVADRTITALAGVLDGHPQ